MVKFLIGLFVGGFIGVMMMALCVASGNAERESEMMTVINHEKERKCKDCPFFKVKAGVIPQSYCAAALPSEDWERKCPLEVKDEERSKAD
jgi:hypothetical protein